jgi:transmembrane sensor
MNHNNIEDLLDCYLKNETSAEENQLVEQWLKDNGNADPAWQTLDPLNKHQWLSGVFAEIKDTINTNQPKVEVIRSRKNLWYSIAAAAAVLMISLGFYLSWPLLGKRILPSDLTTIAVPDHQKKQITLADGSKVWLNAGSELRYPKTFNGKSREIYLSGEAYFDIQHDDSKPFLIHTGKVLTTVLGTAFNIKEDKNTHTIEVTVTRGKVSVADEGKLLGILTPNRQLSINLLNRIPTEKIVDAKAVIAWQDADILFDDITFADAAIQLQQHFHVKIAFSNARLKNCRFSGSTLDGDNLEKILKVICAFNHATWQTKPDGSILIDGPGCNY